AANTSPTSSTIPKQFPERIGGTRTCVRIGHPSASPDARNSLESARTARGAHRAVKRRTREETRMKWTVLTGFAIAGVAMTTNSFAQDRGVTSKDELSGTSPTHAIEIVQASGYSQAFGRTSKDGVRMGDLAKNGTALQLGVGYRANPNWMLGAYGEGAFY